MITSAFQATLVALMIGGIGVGAYLLNQPVKNSDSKTMNQPREEWATKLKPLNESPKRDDKVVLSDSEWQQELTPEQFKILRAQGTERPFCGAFYDNHKKGTYHCVGCDLPLFKSDAKFDSGTGWPSFFQPVEEKSVWYKEDFSHGMYRVEVLCARCDGHLGHVFPDGPAPSKLRFCINSECLTFEESK